MWKKLEVSSKEIIESYTKGRFRICDYNFNNLLLWSLGDNIEYEIEDEILFLRGNYLKRETYFFPIAKDNSLEKTIQGIEKILELNQSVELVPEEWATKLEKKYLLDESRDSFDYTYLVKDLAYLQGRKYTKKRNKINQFIKNNDYIYSEINLENINQVKEFQKKWYEKKKVNEEPELEKENSGIQLILENYFKLGLLGGVIFVKNEIVAYTIGEEVSEKDVVILIEKADDTYSGSYQAINSLFLQKSCEKFQIVNREDDAGVDGLREAKLSYFPFELLKKYTLSCSK